jgi:hypothetical protein
MGDLLEMGQAWLADQLHRHASRQVSYRRGLAQVWVQATIGRTLLKLDDGLGGVRLEWTDRDFLIRAADLALALTPTAPQRGDQVIDGTTTYEVMAYGNEPPWRPADPFGVVLRIHAKRISPLG